MNINKKDKEMRKWLEAMPLQIKPNIEHINYKAIVYHSIVETPVSDLLVYLGCE